MYDMIVEGTKGVYDFLDLNGEPPHPQPALKFPCTMYMKKDKFVSKKSKIYLRYKQRTDQKEYKLGVAELDIAEHLDAKNPAAIVTETITLSFLKSVDTAATITCQLRARWLKDVDVAKLREEDPDAVSKASGFVSQIDDHSQLHPHQLHDHDGEVDEPHDEEENAQLSPEATAARFRRNMSPQSADEETIEDDGTGIGDFVDETPEERAARKAAKKAKKEAKAKKKAAEAARRASAADEEEATDDDADAVDRAASASSAYADILAAAAEPAATTAPIAAVGSFICSYRSCNRSSCRSSSFNEISCDSDFSVCSG